MTTREMTSRERVLAAARHEQPDRVPVVPMIREFALRQYGLTFAECYRNPDAYVDAQLRCLRDTGIDAVWDLFGIAALEEAAGSVLATPEDDPPTITEPILQERRLDLARRIDPRRDGRMPQLIDIVRKLRKAVGPDIAVFGWVSAPFRSACMLRGLENIFMDMYDDPDFVSYVVEYCVGPSVEFALALAEAGADVIEIGNASASSAMISRAAYERFVHPTNRAIIEQLKRAGVTTMMHICGDLNDRADLVFTEGMDIMSFEKLDVPRFKERYGATTCFLGYVGSSSTLLRGTPDEVERESARCIADAGPDGGFILSADCVVPRDTPLENVRAMVRAAERYGRYPLQPAVV